MSSEGAGEVKHLAHTLSQLLGPKWTGLAEYYLRTALKQSWGGVFNGQTGRRRIFDDLLQALPFQAIVETGTFRGTTTEYFARTGLPVFSVESNPRHFAFASLRLKSAGVHLTCMDSREFLRALATDRSAPRDLVFFYLDSHWEAELPLLDEVEIILREWQRPVIMVDDFRVPGEAYGYDVYEGSPLDEKYLSSLDDTDLSYFYPRGPAEAETGMRRGCVVLTASDELRRSVEQVPGLTLRQSTDAF